MTKTYEESSQTGDFLEALRLAVERARTEHSPTDGMIDWRVAAIRGQRGGIAGLNLITVVIEVKQV
ncbi:hypothetical protein [Deinococcus navajonensis]|uniref:Uncharacterized protein n=1 Tax=Deinococcus navajonensis TaxID=309884 RepID=A0ABV8XKK5_9DEIO